MGIHVVKVPDIGEGIAEVELVAWHVRTGDDVAADQWVADVMTDKATVEVPSPVGGRVIEARGAAGDKLAVGSVLLRIEVAEEGDLRTPAVATPSARPPDALPAREAASIPPEPTVAAVPGVAMPRPAAGTRPVASPSVRHHARELGVDLAQVAGSGPDGRILHEDVVRHAAGAALRPAVAGRYAERSGEQAVPVIGLRRQIATRMSASLRIPHFTYVEEIDVTELEVLRSRVNDERARERGRLTLLPFLIRAIVLAVPAFPQMNARYDDEKGIVTHYAAVHVGVATQTGAGLTVPVLRHAEARDLWSCAAEIARLADTARRGTASREELSGSTITITSLGPLGGVVTTPVINPPEVAIVGVNRIVERVALRAGAIVPRKSMNLSSSFDHRVVDGQHAAEFVQAIRGYLECPAMLFID